MISAAASITLLQVVEHEQQIAIGDAVLKPAPGSQRLGDRRDDECRVAHVRQSDPEHPARRSLDQRCCDFHREPALARASRTSERKEADAAVQQREHRLDLVRATDERTRGTSEIRVRDGVERRKPPRAKLEEPGRLCEIFKRWSPRSSTSASISRRVS
jgi:hypothetical protein